MEAYNIYKNAVGGIAYNGDKMKEYDELPEKIKTGWEAIVKYYTPKSWFFF